MYETIKNILSALTVDCFPQYAPQELTYPYIVFYSPDRSPDNTKSGASASDHVTLYVDYYHTTLALAEDLSELGRSALDYYSDDDITSVVFEDQSDDFSFDSNYVQIRQQYTVRLKR